MFHNLCVEAAIDYLCEDQPAPMGMSDYDHEVFLEATKLSPSQQEELLRAWELRAIVVAWRGETTASGKPRAWLTSLISNHFVERALIKRELIDPHGERLTPRGAQFALALAQGRWGLSLEDRVAQITDEREAARAEFEREGCVCDSRLEQTMLDQRLNCGCGVETPPDEECAHRRQLRLMKPSGYLFRLHKIKLREGFVAIARSSPKHGGD